MSESAKQKWAVFISLLVIVASCVWIYFSQFHSPKFNVALHKKIGQVMAEETAKITGPKGGRISIITIEGKECPELKMQLASYEESLKKLGNFKFKEHLLETKDQPKYGIGTGLSGRRFLRVAEKSKNAQVIVSFVGAPNVKDLSESELEKIKPISPVVAEVRSPDHLRKLFDKQLIAVAIVSRFEFPAPGPVEPKTPGDWFNKRYQIVTATNAAQLPKSQP
ncbi:MAG: hypothetical protein ABIQ35_06855 [Verrucomicrobiota bacterium]